ncbi:MAG: ATP-dependent helicase [Acidobacteria bacterium]|nr:ATP-dependent helicase [Acidobacteriota bacterium]
MTKIRHYKLEPKAPSRNYKVRYDADLNREQLDVVMAGDGPILVIAGAGSGKTRALTFRVSRLVEDGTDPTRILLLTFTNKASRSMLSRVEELVQVDTRSIWGGTFHSVGNRLLRRHAELLGFRSNFTILDEDDAKETMESAVSSLGIDTLAKRFPRGDVLASIHSYVVNTGCDLVAYLEGNHPHFLGLTSEIRGVFDRYAEKKRDSNAMDFDDLLLHWRTLLVSHPEASQAIRSRFRHILVDEYQDTNHLQAEIVDLLAQDHRNVMVVGDDAQAIYSFRGASFENILTFPLRWPDCRAFRLETNYRSTPEILALANQSITHNRFQFPKELLAVRASGPNPALVPLDSVDQQAQFVASYILQLRDEGTSLGEIAVLYRSHYQVMELEMELSRRNIPYEIRSGIRFMEQAHIKDVLAFIRIIDNPSEELSWKRAMKLFPRVGERIAAEVWERIASRHDTLASFLATKQALASRAAGESLRFFAAILRKLDSETMRRCPADAIRHVLDEHYRAYARLKFPNAQTRLDDLEELAGFALKYDSVSEFLRDLTLERPIAGEELVVAGTEDEKVVLSSVHQAKGLEWDAVFVIGLCEGRFPSARAMKDQATIVRLPPKLGELPAADAALVRMMDVASPADETGHREISIPGEEEERRLFHVAVTRARRELFLTYPVMMRDRGRYEVLMEASRFVREVDEDLFEKIIVS